MRGDCVGAPANDFEKTKSAAGLEAWCGCQGCAGRQNPRPQGMSERLGRGQRPDRFGLDPPSKQHAGDGNAEVNDDKDDVTDRVVAARDQI